MHTNVNRNIEWCWQIGLHSFWDIAICNTAAILIANAFWVPPRSATPIFSPYAKLLPIYSKANGRWLGENIVIIIFRYLDGT